MTTAYHTPRNSKVLFLDVDGVLNRCGFSSDGLEPDKLEKLRLIVNACDPDIVISSTWRLFVKNLHRLLDALEEIGARCIGITPFTNSPNENGIYISRSRGGEIQQWIDRNGKPSKFVILDDNSDMGDLSPYLVQTQSFAGLTDKDVERVISKLR